MSNQKFEYMLLARLQSDCYTWLSGGGKLWGITPESHAEKWLICGTPYGSNRIG